MTSAFDDQYLGDEAPSEEPYQLVNTDRAVAACVEINH